MASFASSTALMFLVLLPLPVVALTAQTEDQSHCDQLSQVQADANSNKPKAQLALAKMYFKGLCVTQDKDEGGKWLGMSATLGYAPAQAILATLFHRDGNDADAEEWARKAALQGDPQGQSLLAYLYDNGTGLDHDHVEAAKWAKRSAEQGNAGGQIVLGGLLSSGQGVAKDYVEADKWFILASTAKDHTVAFSLSQKTLEVMMSKQEVEEAHRRAAAFTPKPEHPPE